MATYSATPIREADDTRFSFDLLGGTESVESVLRRLAHVRKRFSITELGTLAGVGVLDQYRAAAAKTGLRWWHHPRLALASIYGILAIALPLFGLIAGVAIDVAVFGGAAESLMEISSIYAAFAVGSVVFAVGLAIAPELYKRTLMIVLMIACLGASMIAADAPEFRGHFANWLSFLKTEEVQQARALSEAQQKVSGITASIASQQQQVQPEGRPDLLNDGTPDNDEIARKIYENISVLNTQLVLAKTEVGSAQANLQQATQENSAQYLGRIIGGIYIFCWLLASQVVIAVVIEMASGRLSAIREEATRHAHAVRFVSDIDSRNRGTSKALIEAAVSDMLTKRFNLILAEEAKNDNEKLAGVTDLFNETTLLRMRDLGVELVRQTLSRHSGFGTDCQENTEFRPESEKPE